MLYKCCFLLLFGIIECYSQMICESQQSNNYPIRWPETYDRTFSEPLCIGKNKESLYRKCQNGAWDLEPKCDYVQPTKIPLCPKGFAEFGKYCYKIIYNTSSWTKCPYPDTLPFETFFAEDGFDIFGRSTQAASEFSELTTENFLTATAEVETTTYSPRTTSLVIPDTLWVPAKRTEKFGFIRWYEPSSNYGQELLVYSNDEILNKNCVVYKDGTYQMVDCDEQHATLCVYYNVLNMNDQSCSKIRNPTDNSCTRYDLSSRTSCICAGLSRSGTKLAEFYEIYQNNAVDQFWSCLFGLEKNGNGNYMWASSQEEVNYTLWSSDVIFDDAFVYGKFSGQMWTLTDSTTDKCFISQREIEDPIPSLELAIGNERLILYVENVDSLETFNDANIFCFWGNTDSVFFREFFLRKESVQTLAYSGSAPGYYWCEAFQYSDLSVVKSNTFFYRNPINFEFVAIIRLAYPTNLTNVLSSDLEKLLFDVLHPLSVEIDAEPRLMKITALNETQHYVDVNMHFTLDALLNMSSVTEMYHSANSIITSELQQAARKGVPIFMRSFLSSDYCTEITINGFLSSLTLPTTKLLSPALEVFAEVLCFNTYGDLVKRISCIGNFIDGAFWVSNNFFQGFDTLPPSDHTFKLLTLLDSDNLISDDLLNFVEKIDSLFTADIYFLVELLNKSQKKILSFFTVIDKIYEYDGIQDNVTFGLKQTIKTGVAFRSDRNLQTVISNYFENYSGSSYNLILSNFALVIYVDEIVTGFAVEYLNGKYTIYPKVRNCAEKNLIETHQNLDFAVCFTQKIQTSIAFNIFFNKFVGSFLKPPLGTRSLGVNLIGSSVENKLPAPIKVLYKTSSVLGKLCAIFSNIDDYTLENSYKYDDNFRTCTFLENGYLVFGFSVDFTKRLNTVLNSDVKDIAKIEDLADISKYFSGFQESDVFLVGEILAILTDNTMPLQPLAKIVNNLHKVEKTVLVNSQKKSRALDTILQNIDSILNNSKNSEVSLNTENFFVVTSTNISGVVLQKKDTFEIQVLSGNSNVDEINNFDNVISFVFLSSELQNQLPENSKIIVTVFVNDTLFYEESEDQKSVSTVFGVILPEIGNYSGPIIVGHNISANSNEVMHCSHWNYGSLTKSSSWKKDMDGTKSKNFLRCDFWHATHFALLLLEREVTESLEDLLKSNADDDAKLVSLAQLSEHFSEFQEDDVILVGEILTNLTDITDLQPLAKTVNNLHKIEKTVLVNSQKKGRALDTILQSIDSILNNSYTSDAFLSTENFFVVTSTNISGVVLLQKNASFEIQVLRDNSSNEEINSFDNVVSFVFLSSELKKQLPKNSKIIATIFVYDTLFYEESEHQKSVSTVFGVILPEIGNYSGPITVEHNMSAKISEVMHCSHWTYGSPTKNSSWEKNQDGVKSKKFLKCDFWHTTHFALLLLNSNVYTDAATHWITMTCTIISLVGLSVILMTGLFFKAWRKQIGNQILFNVSLAITLEIVMFYIGVFYKNSNDWTCTLIGSLLQYSIMSQFFWSLVVAVIQYKRFVIVFTTFPDRLLLKCCFCGWGLPLIPVLYTLGLNGSYTNNNIDFCYPSDRGLYWGVWLPTSAIVLINVAIFICIAVCLCQSRPTGTVKNTSRNKHKTRLLFFLFFTLGLTWCFGFLSLLELGIIFVYIFNATATLQGFILFLYYIVFNSRTKEMYAISFKKTFCCKKHS